MSIQVLTTCALGGFTNPAEVFLRSPVVVDTGFEFRFPLGAMRCLCIMLSWLMERVLEDPVLFSFGGDLVVLVEPIFLMLVSPSMVLVVLDGIQFSRVF